jgi:glyoxylase-like metal-dependent hydrolase (beta-lactamase superfamily II)
VQQITDKVFWLTDAVGARCYWIDLGPDRAAIVDPGMTPGLNRVARELRRAGRSPYEVTDILLTHADIDHAQVAAEWQRRTGARTWLGAADAAILTGAAQPASPFRKFSSKVGTPELPGKLQLLDGDIEVAPGLVALKTTGHTPGHHAFRFGTVLFAGDAAKCELGKLEPMPAFLDDNVHQSAAALARLKALEVDWYCCGHSDPQPRSTL